MSHLRQRVDALEARVAKLEGWHQNTLGKPRYPEHDCPVCQKPVPAGRRLQCSRRCTTVAADRRRDGKPVSGAR